MASASGKKLKDPHVCRVFISSPFNGMEGERETLTRLYWPKLQVFCAQRGIQLRLVDMRWGIKADSDAQTINICLKELERSDLFIGFFGQRYGWAGINDAELQRNFDMATERFPWIDDYRNRSVTEIEFLGGHLNKPGDMPAAICFRDKSFDDEKLEEGRRLDNKKMLRSFAVENPESAKRMEDLKERVKASEDKALGVLMDYKTPEEGAQFLFECLWKYVTEVMFTSEVETPLGPLEVERGQHDAFRNSRSAHYVGGESELQTVQSFITDKKENILFVTGEAGSGKSSLMCQWLNTWHKMRPDDGVVYHFIGCAAGSTGLDQILQRLISELELCLEKKTTTHQNSEKEKAKNPKLNQPQLARNLQQILREAAKRNSVDKVILLVDGLDKLDAGSKAGKPLYWIPKSLEGDNVKIILTTTDADTANINAMEEYEHIKLVMDPLSSAEKTSLCLAILNDNSKELAKEQLEIVLSSEKTNNPLFLKILIDELCAFGYFRLLTKRIEELVAALSIEELLTKCVERLETDYNPKTSTNNPVKDVLCGIVLSRSGLSENEIMEMFELDDKVWSPIYFALDKYLVKRQGLLSCAFTELETAITKKYMDTKEEKLEHLKNMCNFFYDKCQETGKVTDRIALELPYLLNSAKDPRLPSFISDLEVFERIFQRDGTELLVYWENIGWTDKEVKRFYSRSLDVKLADNYLSQLEVEPTKISAVSNDVFQTTNKIRQIAEEGNFNIAAIYFGERSLKMLNHLKYTEAEKASWRRIILAQKAVSLNELGENDKAMELHTQLVQERRREYDRIRNYETITNLASSLHSIGVVHMKLNHQDESIKYHNEAIELFRSVDEEDKEKTVLSLNKSISNVALSYMWQGKLEESLELFKQVLEAEEDYFFNELPLDIAYTFTNMGLVCRRLNNLDNAEKYYMRALEMKTNLLGHRTMDVALSYINLAQLENYRGNREKGLEHTSTAVDIYKSIKIPTSNLHYQMALENLAFDLYNTGRKEEAYEAYFNCLDVLEEHNNCEQLLDSLFRSILQDMVAQQNWERAARMLVAFIPTSKAAPDIYDTLYKVDKMYLKKNHLDRPKHLTAIAGFDRFPQSDVLWRAKMELLMDTEDEEGIMKHGDHFRKMAEEDEKFHELASSSYAFGAKWMLEDVPTSPKRLNTIYNFLSEGHKYYPEKPEISQHMYVCLERMDRMPEAVPYLEKFVEAVPNNPAVLGLCCKHRIKIVPDVEKARHYLDRLAKVAGEDESIQKQVETHREEIEYLEKQEESKNQ